jgi:hypothetical protein
MASKASEYFKFLILISLFFGVTITTVLYYLPADAKAYVNPITGHWTQLGPSDQMEQSQSAIDGLRTSNPVVQAVALFQTGVFVIDLFLNSLFALPQMVTMFISGIFLFAPIDPYLQSVVLTVLLAACVITYLLLLIGLLVSIRAGTVI